MVTTSEIITLTDRYGARNYNPLPIVISKAEGVWVEDPEGNRYMDFLSAYSAVSQGHRHPRVVQALMDQAQRVKERVLPMNTGAEAVETAIKAIRRWAYRVKGVEQNKAEIIVCEGNFHGRTTTIISFSSDPGYKKDFGPFTPGFKLIPYGDIDAFEDAINENTAAFLVEPIQGEAGIRIPPEGYLRRAAELCKQHNILLAADEIQTGFGRTGKLFGCDWEGVVPDIYIMGKALGAGVYPVSAVAADEEVLGVFEPGSHGSTFGGNPLGAAVGVASLEVIVEEHLPERSLELGEYLNEHITELRGRGLFVGIELDTDARPYCEALKKEGVLAKETHVNVIRLAPPLVITRDELDWAIERIRGVLEA